jgi:hypothetical protein
MISIGYNPYLDIIVKRYACYKISLGMHMEKNIMELETTYKCSQGKDTLHMYMTN